MKTKSQRWPVVVIAIVVLIIYGQSVTFNFVYWDDQQLIANNPMVLNPGWESLKQAWTKPFMQIYMPLTYTWWIIEGIPARFVGTIPARQNSSLPPASFISEPCFFILDVVIRRFVSSTDSWETRGRLYWAPCYSPFIPYRPNPRIGSARTRV